MAKKQTYNDLLQRRIVDDVIELSENASSEFAIGYLEIIKNKLVSDNNES